jgi:hypothetical protein
MESPDVEPPSATAARLLGPQSMKWQRRTQRGGVATSMLPVAALELLR